METTIKKKYNYQVDPVTGKNKTGRPVKWDNEALTKVGTELLAWYDESEDNLFIGEFLQQQGLYSDLICQYVDSSEDFSRLIKLAKEKQEWRLNKLAIKNINNPYYTKFIMMNHHGYSDKKETNITGLPLPSLNFVLLNNSEQPKTQQIQSIQPLELPDSVTE